MIVQLGQIWADRDIRQIGRRIRVDAIDGQSAICTIVDQAPSGRWSRWNTRPKHSQPP